MGHTLRVAMNAASEAHLEILKLFQDSAEDGAVLVDASERILGVAGSQAALALFATTPVAGQNLGECGADFRLHAAILEAKRAGSAHRSVRIGTNHIDVTARQFAGLLVLWLRDRTSVSRLETVNRDLIANVSHELRTPIAAIKLVAETLQSGALTDADAAPEFVRRIVAECSEVEQMLDELLQLNRIESRTEELDWSVVSAADLIAAVNRLQPLLEEHSLRLEIKAPASLPTFPGDIGKLQQVIRNLVHNAIKFTGPGGEIELAFAADNDAFVISVSDTGCGIAAADLPRIFERFWKVDRARQRTEGAGIGLSIVRHIVDAHQGTIDVQSEVSRGTKFTIRIPLDRKS